MLFAGYALRGTVPYNFESLFMVFFLFLTILWVKNKSLTSNQYLKQFSLFLFLYFLIVITLTVYHGVQDGASTQKLALVALFPGFIILVWLLYQLKPSIDYFWYFLIAASFIMLIWFSMELSVLGLEGIEKNKRFGDVYSHPIKFGIYANALLIVMPGGLLWAFKKGKTFFAFWIVLILMNLMFVVLSGTRTAWIGWPEAIIGWGGYYLFLVTRTSMLKWQKSLVVVTPLVLVIGVFSLQPIHDAFGKRIHAAQNDVQNYLNGSNPFSSLGSRFVMYEASLNLIGERPLLGYGSDHFSAIFKQETSNVLQERFDKKHPGFDYSHAHNQLLMSWIQYGIFAVIALLAIFAYLMFFFWKGARSAEVEDKPIFIAGLIFTIASFLAFMPESPLEFSVYTAHYLLFISLLFVFALITLEKRTQSTA